MTFFRVILLSLALTFISCNNHTPELNEKYTGVLEKTYVSPKRIIWQSEHANIENSDLLLNTGTHQASLINKNITILRNGMEPTSILLDFGKELHGGLEIITGMALKDEPVPVRIRFGESVSEAMAEINQENGATNDHAIRDWKIQLPWLGKIEIGNTGFRFVRIDLLGEGTELYLKEVNAISILRNIPYLGSFKSNDDRLNQIWQTGAYTVHLNMQEYLWDGIKRDRLVWVGDMHPEIRTIMSVFGPNQIVNKSLDFIAESTPPDQWMNNISSYSMWWLIIQYQYYFYTGDIEYLKKHKDYIFMLLSKLDNRIDETGKENLDGNRFLDWPTSEDSLAVHAGLQSMMVMTFTAGKKIAEAFAEDQKALEYGEIIQKLKLHRLQMPDRKSSGALMVLAGISDPKVINDDLLTKEGSKDISSFYGYYVLNVMAEAGNYRGALDLIREYWGGMLDLGATTFWENFNVEWLENASRIDELVPQGKVDVHSTYGDYCYKGLRHSLCHGWASGPTAWLSQYVLGIEIMEPGCKTIKITPNLGDLEWVEGTFPTPFGEVKLMHEKQADGTVKTVIEAPESIKIILD